MPYNRKRSHQLRRRTFFPRVVELRSVAVLNINQITICIVYNLLMKKNSIDHVTSCWFNNVYIVDHPVSHFLPY